MTTFRTSGRAIVLVVAVALTLFVAACGDSGDDKADLTVANQWVKAVPQGQMTAAFGVLTNTTDSDIHVTAASSPAAGRMELHEVVPGVGGAMQMRQKDGGFVISAHGSLELTPGGYHLMMFDLPAPLTPGEDVAITLTLFDGSTTSFSAQVRDFAGANEDYVPGHGMPTSTTAPGA